MVISLSSGAERRSTPASTRPNACRLADPFASGSLSLSYAPVAFQPGQIIDVCHAAVADCDCSIAVNATVRHYCEET